MMFQTNLKLFLQLDSLKINWMIDNISIYPLCDDLRSKVLLCDQYVSFFVEGEANKLNVNLQGAPDWFSSSQLFRVPCYLFSYSKQNELIVISSLPFVGTNKLLLLL